MTSDELKELLTEYIDITKNNLEIFAKHSELFPKTDPQFKTKAWTKEGKEKVAMTYKSSTGKRYKNKSTKIKNKTYRNVTLQRGSKISGYLSSGKLAPYIAILNENHKQTVNNGIYPFYYYDLNKDVLLLTYGKSKAKIPKPTWNFSSTGKTLAGGVYKSYNCASIKTWNYDQMLKDLDDMIDDYEIALGLDPKLKTKRADGSLGIGTGNIIAITPPPANPPKHPLNLILYGPPGTGKTYNTLFHALAIIKNTDVKKLQKRVEDGTLKYDDLKKEYDTYVKSGQIVFTTFHQSMSYEDFIEGIKPIPDKINIEAEHKNNTKSKSTLFGDGTTTIKNLSRMKYEVKDGVFRQICKDAGKSYEISHKIVLKDVIDYFCFDLEKTGKVIECSKSGTKYRINKIKTKKDGVYDTIGLTNDNNTSQTIKVQVIRDNYENYKKGIIKDHTDIQPSRSSRSKTYGNSELCYGLLERIKDFEDNRYPQYTSGTLNTEVTGKQNYVLIIDEINRGNVAQIFGELITLIEPSKRLGNNEAMTATLPYSQKPFGVPNNLYIIGTMNTADRSVEALDTALRRRFSFEEMMPKAELLGDTEVCGVKLSKLLKTINDRIVAIKDREHQIGHSYFMWSKEPINKEEWLANVFKDKIIPLLQEYFYGDYKKIYYVLGGSKTAGEGFVKIDSVTKSDIFAVKIDDDYDYDIPEIRYEIQTIDETFDINKAIGIMLKKETPIEIKETE